MRRFLSSVIDHNPAPCDQVLCAAGSLSDHVFVWFLRHEWVMDPAEYARRQHPVLQGWAV